jgi:hypothetical protein
VYITLVEKHIISRGERLFGLSDIRLILSYIHYIMTEKNSLIPNMYITQYRLK